MKPLFSSDHRVVVTRFSVRVGTAPRVTRSRAYNYKRADFIGLRRTLSLLPWHMLEDLDVDSAVTLFYDLIFAAVNDHVPVVELRRKFPPWFDRDVRQLLREKEQAHRRKKVNPSAENTAEYARARADFKRIADRNYRDYLTGLIREFKDNPKRYWSFVKTLKSGGKVSPVLECDGSVYRDAVDRANCFNSCFSKKFSDPEVRDSPQPPMLNCDGLSTFRVPRGRVALLLRELSTHKACGADGLSARILHECADEFAVPLEILCRLSVRSGVFPSEWKRANVIPVHKKGSKKLPENYRPVSLLPICSKILEKVVSEGLLEACLPALPDSQHGFLPKRSCTTNLACFLEHCWASLAEGTQTDAIYTDYSSAFTSVNHRLLLLKLRHSFNITGLAYRWIESYLCQRSQRVIIDGKHSEWTPVLSGVPEGSILGPLLFACYVADLPNNIKTGCLAYADDVKIFHRIQNHGDTLSLQADLDRLCEWSKTWHLKLNPAKCKTISFTLRTAPVQCTYELDGHQLERCQRMRDLGVILDAKLTFADHVDATVGKANRMLGLLMRSIQTSPCARRPDFNHHAILSAYKAHVMSAMEYASVIWSGAAATHLKRMERLHHRFLMWLGCKTQPRCPSMDYASLLSHFNSQTVKARFIQADIKFLQSVLHGRLDCQSLVSMFSLAVPTRRTRHTGMFHVPGGRVNSVRNSFMSRIPATCDALLKKAPETDFFYSPSSFRSQVLKFANSEGAY